MKIKLSIGLVLALTMAGLALSAAPVEALGFTELHEHVGIGNTHFQLSGLFAPGPGPVVAAPTVPFPLTPGGFGLGPIFPGAVGASACRRLQTPAVAAVACAFADFAFAPAAGYHYEFELFNAATVPNYNLVLFDGFGNVHPAIVLGHAVGTSLYLDMHTPDWNGFFPFVGAEVGIGGVWAASGLPGTMDINMWVGEGIGVGAGLFNYPGAPAGKILWRSFSEIELLEGTDPTLPTFGLFDANLAFLFPQLFEGLAAAAPLPAPALLLGAGLLLVSVVARLRARRR